MVMGFISLFLVVFQAAIVNICMPETWADFMLPCPYDKNARAVNDYGNSGRRKLLATAAAQVQSLITIGGRKLLDPEAHMRRLAAAAGKCPTVR